MPKTSTERARACRQRKRGQAPPIVKRPPKSAVQRVREYRARQKALQAVAVAYNNPALHALQDTNRKFWLRKSNEDDSEPTMNELPLDIQIGCTEIKTEPIDVEDDSTCQKPDEDSAPEDDAAEDPLKLDYSSENGDGRTTEGVSTVEDKNYIDEDKAFLLSLLPAMKELNGIQKMEFKMMILDSLKRLRYPVVETPSNKVGNVTLVPIKSMQEPVVPIKSIQGLNNLGPLISIHQPPSHIKQGVNNVIAFNVAGFHAAHKPVPTDIPSQKHEAPKPTDNSVKVVQSRQAKRSGQSEPAAKKQKTHVPPIGNPTALKFTTVMPIIQPETELHTDRASSSSSSSTPSKTIRRRRTYKAASKVTEPQIIVDTRLPSTQPSIKDSNNIDVNVSETETDSRPDTEIDVDEIKLEFIKVEPFEEYQHVATGDFL